MATLVTLQDGGQGIVETDSPFAEAGKTVVRLDTGRRLIIRDDALIAQSDGSYRLPLTKADLADPAHIRSASAEYAPAAATPEAEAVVVPLIAETLAVGKRTVVTGGVRLTKRVSEHEETVDEPLLREEVHVERVPVNQMVDAAPEARYEGDTLIVPVLEEVLVVEKRLMLKEEIHIKRSQTEVHEPQTISVRTEDVVIEEIAPAEPRL